MANSSCNRKKYWRICKNGFKAIHETPNFNFWPPKNLVFIFWIKQDGILGRRSSQHFLSQLLLLPSSYFIVVRKMIEVHTRNKISFIACWDTENIPQHFWKVLHWSTILQISKKATYLRFYWGMGGLTFINLSVQPTFPIIYSHSSCYRETSFALHLSPGTFWYL